MSVVGKRKGRFGEGYGPYLSHPRNLIGTVLGVAADVVGERRAAGEQVRRDIQPRIRRSFRYAFMRAFTTVVMRDVCVHAVIGAMAEGRSQIYVDLLGYDEVAHHSGIERHDAMTTLRLIDRQVGRIDRARDRVAATEVDLLGPDGPAGSVAGDRTAGAGAPVVMASGNLGLIDLPYLPGRATREDIDALHPGLLEALRTHPGVGFVLVASREQGSIMLGPAGERLLGVDGDGAVLGEDPLGPFGPHALAVVRRADRYRTVADLMVNSFFDAATEEVAAFEELVGSHGGLGGPQSHPFLLVPSAWELSVAPLLGATDVHGYLMGQLS